MNIEQVQYVDKIITSRHSVRAFLDTPVAMQTIHDILESPAVRLLAPIPNRGKSMWLQATNVRK